MRLAVNRRLKAVVLLLLMVSNFAIEGTMLYRIYGPLPIASALCALVGTADTEGASCCAPEKPVAICDCTCCGGQCTMGDACTCTPDGPVTTNADGLFFRMPGCKPFPGNGEGQYLPLSVRLVYLPADVARAADRPLLVLVLHDTEVPIHDIITSPAVPPPECSVA